MRMAYGTSGSLPRAIRPYMCSRDATARTVYAPRLKPTQGGETPKVARTFLPGLFFLVWVGAGARGGGAAGVLLGEEAPRVRDPAKIALNLLKTRVQLPPFLVPMRVADILALPDIE